ncbi:MAG: hypothetical protein M1832_004004 [Thelocarpon impressellum]|nr:MAG: hypothetical protein M1832_004004 [Thelocarpon impressellum]
MAASSLLRAYALGYLSSTSPRLITTLISLSRKGESKEAALSKLFQSLRAAFAADRFPAFCAVLVGGSTLLHAPIRRLLARGSIALGLRTRRAPGRASDLLHQRSLATFLATLLAAWLALSLLNGRRGRERGAAAATAAGESKDPGREPPPAPAVPEPAPLESALAGRTMDLTLFAATRALDVVVGELWARRRSRRLAAGRWTRAEAALGQLADAGVFAVSAGTVMWAWFYRPARLPRAYNRWIREAAAVDDRLVLALQRAKTGHFVYGGGPGQAPFLQDMCRDYGWPVEWGDPATTIPLPCEVVHMGVGPSCERHAASRFLGAFKFALATYLPLNLVLRARSPSKKALVQAVADAVRSSSFLAAFISIFYYSICLCRTRLGPKIFSRDTVTPTMWDAGLDIGAGCALCGWSILIEAPRRRHEVAAFVAPRAAATFFPRRYDPKFQWREKLAFATSAAVIFTCMQERPERVRGVLGRVLKQVLGDA